MGIYYKGDLTFKTRKSIMHFKKHVHLDPKDNHHSSWYDSHDKQAVRHATTWYDNELRGNSTSTSSGRWNPDEIQMKSSWNEAIITFENSHSLNFSFRNLRAVHLVDSTSYEDIFVWDRSSMHQPILRQPDLR